MAIPLIALEIGAGLLLPTIMKAVGKKALPSLAKLATKKALTRVPTGMAVIGGKLVSTSGLPTKVLRTATHRTGQLLPAALRGASPTAVSGALNTLGRGLTATGEVAGAALPWGLMLAGSGIKAGGIAAGALTGAAGRTAGELVNAAAQIPGALSTISGPQFNAFGGTPSMTLGKIGGAVGQGLGTSLASIGNAAGLGIGALTGAAGDWVHDIGRTQRLAQQKAQLDDQLYRRLLEVQNTGADPHTKDLVGRWMSAQGRF